MGDELIERKQIKDRIPVYRVSRWRRSPLEILRGTERVRNLLKIIYLVLRQYGLWRRCNTTSGYVPSNRGSARSWPTSDRCTSQEIGRGPLISVAEVVSDSVQLCMSAVIMGLIRQPDAFGENVETRVPTQGLLIFSFEWLIIFDLGLDLALWSRRTADSQGTNVGCDNIFL